jgi:hypothetical protein
MLDRSMEVQVFWVAEIIIRFFLMRRLPHAFPNLITDASAVVITRLLKSLVPKLLRLLFC